MRNSGFTIDVGQEVDGGEDGPPVKRFYGRRALYSKDDLRNWAIGLTSEQPAPLDAA